jgi:hypothetical protein
VSLVALAALAISAISASCSSSSPSSGGSSNPPGLTCAVPGEATPGPSDTHCVGQPVQAVNASSCFPDAGAAPDDANDADDADDANDANDAGAADTGTLDATVGNLPNVAFDDAGEDGGAPATECAYGSTMFGPGSGDGAPQTVEGDDDDCKYHVSWTSGPICRSTLGVKFIVTVTYLQSGLPVTNIPSTEGILPEAFVPTTLDAACDTMSTHPSPTSFGDAHLYETSPTSGVYQGQIVFDVSGEWTLRFHIHEECSDLLDDSPHGHAAFHITVP